MNVQQGHAKGNLGPKCFTQWPEWPHCLQNCAATASTGTEAQNLMTTGSPTVPVCHQVQALITKRASQWMSSARLLQCETCSVAQEDSELRTGEGFNPASCLNSPQRGWEETQHCIQVTQLQTQPGGDSGDIAWPEAENVFVDGSSRAAEGKRVPRHAVIEERESDKAQVTPHGQLNRHSCVCL